MENGSGVALGYKMARSVRGNYAYSPDDSKQWAAPGSKPLDWSNIMKEFQPQHECILEFQERLGFKFNQPELLYRAFTHSSAWTLPVWLEVIPRDRQCYEKLECIGDSVLHTIILDKLMEHGMKCLSRPDVGENDWQVFNEGWLTKNLSTLARAESGLCLAVELNIVGCVMAGSGVMDDSLDVHMKTTKERILGDVFESIIGAMYFDQGFEKTKIVVGRWIQSRVDAIPLLPALADAKGRVLSMFSRVGNRIRFDAEVVSGPSHAPVFEARLLFHEHVLASARAPTKRQASNAAAAKYLEMYARFAPVGTLHDVPLVRDASGNILEELDESEDDQKLIAEICKGKHPLAYVNDESKWLVGRRPDWVEITVSGPSHNPVFIMSMQLNNKELARGEGTAKKLAKEQAACIVAKQMNEHGKQWLSIVSGLPIIENNEIENGNAVDER